MKKYLYGDANFRAWVSLLLAKDAVSRVRAKELRQYGLSSSKAAVLYAVKTIGKNATIAEISRWLLRRPHSISEMIDRMERDGLVKKVSNSDRKNVKRVVMTRKGQKMFSCSSEIESIREIFSCLSNQERRQLMSCLKKIKERALQKS